MKKQTFVILAIIAVLFGLIVASSIKGGKLMGGPKGGSRSEGGPGSVPGSFRSTRLDTSDSDCVYVPAKGDYHAQGSRYQPANDDEGTFCHTKRRNMMTKGECSRTTAARSRLPDSAAEYPFENFYKSSVHHDDRFVAPTAYYKSRHIHATIPASIKNLD